VCDVILLERRVLRDVFQIVILSSFLLLLFSVPLRLELLLVFPFLERGFLDYCITDCSYIDAALFLFRAVPWCDYVLVRLDPLCFCILHPEEYSLYSDLLLLLYFLFSFPPADHS